MKSNHWNILGSVVLLVFAGTLALTGTPSGVTPLMAAEELSGIALSGEDKLNPVVLGEWIIEEKKDFVIIDLRSPFEFSDFNIPGSQNIPFPNLMTKQGIDMLPRAKKVILVSSDGTRAGQAWVVLRGKGFNALILDGGAKGWWDNVMTPATVQNPDEKFDTVEYSAKLRVMREKFSGSGNVLSAPQDRGQTSAPPPPPIPSGGGSAKKKKSGGC